ncbi:hypothetical protein PLESTM_000537600 [Pleodorina starrii]|nr:hypothetical protein PLESTM_000537600 [Pleodorina starrii]
MKVRLHFLDLEDPCQQLKYWLWSSRRQHRLLEWWPRFKEVLRALIGRLNKEARERQLVLSEEATAAAAAAAAVMVRLEQGDTSAAPDVITTRAEAAAKAMKSAAGAARRARHAWLREDRCAAKEHKARAAIEAKATATKAARDSKAAAAAQAKATAVAEDAVAN